MARGGSRPGAGRKKKPTEQKLGAISIWMSHRAQDELIRLAQKADKTVSEMGRILLEQKLR